MNCHFVTYFDVNYAARGLAMVDSLLRSRPHSTITVLCLDDQTADIVRAELDDRVTTVSCATLAGREPRLNEVHADRTAWEFYATHKPVFIDWALDQSPVGASVSFIDADTFFFSSPEPIFAEVESSSVAVSPHRFNRASRHLSIYGQFNAGFGVWRNDAIGRQCVRDWIEQCLDWCYCRVEADGRFMNQGYLGAWPSRYGRVAVIGHPGANLGPWNVGSHRLECARRRVLVDGQALVFFHFSGVSHTREGRWQTFYPYQALRQPVVLERIYAPYLFTLETTSQRLMERFGISGLGSVRSVDAGVPALDLVKGHAYLPAAG
jgi:hypothetical protein